MPTLLSKNNQALAENVILKYQLAEIENIVCVRQECKNDKRIVLRDRNVIRTSEILKKLNKMIGECKFEEKGYYSGVPK